MSLDMQPLHLMMNKNFTKNIEMIPVLIKNASKFSNFSKKFGLAVKHPHKHHTYQAYHHHKTSKISCGIEKFTFSFLTVISDFSTDGFVGRSYLYNRCLG